jgi:hypothetical protein
MGITPHIAHTLSNPGVKREARELRLGSMCAKLDMYRCVANGRQNQVHVSYNPNHAIRGYNLGVTQVPHEMGTTTPQISG